MKFKQYMGKEKKAIGRVVAMLLACTMVAGFAMPFGASAMGKLYNDAPKYRASLGDEEEEERETYSLGRTGNHAQDEDDIYPTIGMSTLFQALQKSETQFVIGLKPETEQAIETGKVVNLNVRVGLEGSKGWPTYQYSNDANANTNTIIKKVEEVQAVVTLPEGMEYAGEETDAMWSEGQTVYVKFMDMDNPSYPEDKIPVRFVPNGGVANGTKGEVTAKLEGMMTLVTKYERRGDTFEPAETETATFDDAGLNIACQTTLTSSANEDWGVLKINKGNPVVNSGNVTFRFNTGFGAVKVSGENKELYTAADEPVYNRFGRLFIKELGVDETFEFWVKLDSATAEYQKVELTAEEMGGLFPTVSYQYNEVTGHSEQTKPGEDAFTEVKEWRTGPYYYGTNHYYKELKPSDKSNPIVGMSPNYTNYDLSLTFSQQQLREIAEQTLGSPDSFVFKVTSKAGLGCTFVGGGKSEDSSQAEQEYALPREGGSIIVRQYWSKEHTTDTKDLSKWYRYNREGAAGQPELAGEFAFTLKDENNNEVSKMPRIVQGSDGETQYIFDGLKPGKYTVQETAGGFVNYKDTQKVLDSSVTTPSVSVELTNATNMGQANFYATPLPSYELKIAKRIEFGGELLKEAATDVWFAMYPTTDEGLKAVKEILVKDSVKPEELEMGWLAAQVQGNHFATFAKVPEGEYYIIELPSENYVKNPEIYTRKFPDGTSASDKYAGVYDSKGTLVGTNSLNDPIRNTRNQGKIQIQKNVMGFVKDGNAVKPSNTMKPAKDQFEFTLIAEDGTTSMGVSVKNDAKGFVTFDAVTPGKYYIKEEKAEGWVENTKLIGPFTVKSGEITTNVNDESGTCTITNYPSDAFIVFQKVDEKGNAIASTDTDKENKSLAFQVKKEGALNPIGKYERANGGDNIGYYRANTGGMVYAWTNPNNGILIIRGLEPNTRYELIENEQQALNKGYEIVGKNVMLTTQTCVNEAEYDELLKNWNTTSTEHKVVNKKVTTWSIDKAAEYEKNTLPLGGATIYFYTRSQDGKYEPFKVGETHVYATSDANGHFNFTPADASKRFDPNMQYYILETEFPKGFEKPADATWIKIEDKEGALYGPYKPGATTVITNVPGARYGGSVKKIDGDSKVPIAGARFTVTYQGSPIGGVYQDASGKIQNFSAETGFTTIKGETKFWISLSGEEQEPVTVTLTEVAAPNGYLLPVPSTVEITLKKGTGTIETGKTKEIENVKEASLRIAKYRGTAGNDNAKTAMTASFRLYEQTPDGKWQHFGKDSGNLYTANFTGLDASKTYAIAEVSTSGVFNGIVVGGTSYQEAVTIDGLTAYVIPEGALKNGEKLELKAYNMMPAEITAQKLDKAGEPITDLSGAVFELYRPKEGTFTGTVDDTMLAEKFEKVEGAAFTTSGGTVRFSGLEKPADASKVTYLIVEVTPPTGYLLDPAAYGEDYYAYTRTLVTVDFDSGISPVAAEKPLTNLKAEDIGVPATENGSITLDYEQPRDQLDTPLQELDEQGSVVRFKVTNSTTGKEDSTRNLVPLYDFTIDRVGAQRFLSGGSEVSSATYDLLQIRIPEARDEGGAVPFAAYADGDSVAPLATSEGGELILDEARLEGVKYVRVVYGRQGEYGPENGKLTARRVGSGFSAPAITVEARLNQMKTTDAVDKLEAQAELSFYYYRDGAMQLKAEIGPVKASDSIVIPASSLKPKATIQKHVTKDGVEAGESFIGANGDTLHYTITISVEEKALENALVVDVMPPHIELDEGTVKYSGSDESSHSLVPATEEGTGNPTHALVVKLAQIPVGTFTISYDATVREEAAMFGPTASNVAYLTSNNPLIAPTASNPLGQTFFDNNGQPPAPNGKVTNLWDGKEPNLGYISNNANFSLAADSKAVLYKWVKGGLDSSFKRNEDLGYTTPGGGDVLYKFTFTNTKGIRLSDLRVGDLLPREGDGRASAWAPILDGAGCVSATSSSGNIKGATVHVQTSGTDSASVADAVTDGSYKNWPTLTNENAKSAQAIVAQLTGYLEPNEMLTVTIDMSAPEMAYTETGSVTTNAGVISAKEIENDGSGFNRYQSNLAKVTTSPSLKLGDRVWFDADRDGVQSENKTAEPGVANVKVTLYTYVDGVLDGSRTRDTMTDKDGLYGFDNLTTYGKEKISYKLAFSQIPDNMKITKRGAGTVADDSDPDAITGETGQFRFVREDADIRVMYQGEGREHTFKADLAEDMSFDCGLVLERKVPVSITKTVLGTAIEGYENNDTYTFELYQISGGTELLLGSATVSAGSSSTAFNAVQGGPLKLNVGQYRIREKITYGDGNKLPRYALTLQGPEGMTKDDDGSYLFAVTNTSSEESIHFGATNTLQTGSLTITKSLVNGQTPVAGDTFTFALYRVNGNERGEFVQEASIEAGQKHTFTNLPVGEYAVMEKDTPGYMFQGWRLPNDGNDKNKIHKFTIDANGAELEFEAVNKIVTGDLVIQKNLTGYVTAADRAAQFSFDLYQAQRDGEEIAIGERVTTMSVGYARPQSYSNMKPGVYAVMEQAYAGFTFEGFDGSTGGDVRTIDGNTYYVFEVSEEGDGQRILINATNRTRRTPPTPPNRPNRDRPTRDTPDNTPTYTPNTPDLIDIPDEPVPLAQDPLIDIPDEPVPLAGLPDMGGFTPMHLVPLGGLLIVAGFLLTRKKKGPNGEKR